MRMSVTRHNFCAAVDFVQQTLLKGVCLCSGTKQLQPPVCAMQKHLHSCCRSHLTNTNLALFVCAAEPLLPCCAAVIGRGMNDVAFRAHAIQATMEQMLHAAALPILSDVQLSVPGLSHLQLFPDPIPDVFVGQPLLVSGKFAGPWPELIHISGTLPSGEREWGTGGQGFMAAAAVWNKISC